MNYPVSNHNFSSTLVIVVWGMVLISCEAETVQYDSIDASSVDIELALELHDSDEVFFGSIADAMIASDGSFLVSDPTRKRIHIFDSEGRFKNSALNEGQGPGEVERMAWNFGYTDQDEIIIYDSSHRRVSIYEFTGDDLTVSTDINIEPFPVNFHLKTNKDIVLHTRPSPGSEDQDKDRIMLTDLNGTIKHENLIEFKSNEQIVISNPEGVRMMSFSSAHHARNLVRFYGDKLIYARSDELGFIIYDLNSGEIIQQVSLQRPDYPLPMEERREFVDGMLERSGLEDVQTSDVISEMPETKGKVKNLHYDPTGYVWLNIIDEQGPDWLKFSLDGDLAGTLDEPFDGNVIHVQYGKILVSAEDEDGAPMVKIYRYNYEQ